MTESWQKYASTIKTGIISTLAAAVIFMGGYIWTSSGEASTSRIDANHALIMQLEDRKADRETVKALVNQIDKISVRQDEMFKVMVDIQVKLARQGRDN